MNDRCSTLGDVTSVPMHPDICLSTQQIRVVPWPGTIPASMSSHAAGEGN